MAGSHAAVHGLCFSTQSTLFGWNSVVLVAVTVVLIVLVLVESVGEGDARDAAVDGLSAAPVTVNAAVAMVVVMVVALVLVRVVVVK
jgi:hypothetical protein